MKLPHLCIFSVTICLFACLVSCDKNNDDGNKNPTILKQWDVELSTVMENPNPPGRTETGVANLTLLSDSSIEYHLMVGSVAGGDQLTMAHIHFGDPVTNGQVIVNFNPSFASNMATGIVTGLRKSLMDSLLTGTVYVNIHSQQFPAGLVRGQMNETIDFTADVALSGMNEVGPVTTTATGLALLRLTTDKKLYSKVTVSDVEPDDEITLAHIHNGAAGVNGGVLQLLCSSKEDFDVSKMYELTDEKLTALKTNPVYVNAHSIKHPGGIVRGQIR